MSLREPPVMCTIHDCATGETTERELTEEEYATRDAMMVAFEEQQAAEEQAKADAINGRQKLLDLGLSEAEVSALLGSPPPAGAPDVEASEPVEVIEPVA